MIYFYQKEVAVWIVSCRIPGLTTGTNKNII